VVGRPERRPEGKGAPSWLDAGGGVDFRDLKGLGLGKRGQDAGKAARQHRFACAGGADHQQVVTAGSRDFEGLLPERLAAYVCQVRCGRLILRHRCCRQLRPAPARLQHLDQLFQVGDGPYGGPLDQAGLTGRRRGHDDGGLAYGGDQREDARYPS
jgi:hypothetical protein